jgi:hypothetical protein
MPAQPRGTAGQEGIAAPEPPLMTPSGGPSAVSAAQGLHSPMPPLRTGPAFERTARVPGGLSDRFLDVVSPASLGATERPRHAAGFRARARRGPLLSPPGPGSGPATPPRTNGSTGTALARGSRAGPIPHFRSAGPSRVNTQGDMPALGSRDTRTISEKMEKTFVFVGQGLTSKKTGISSQVRSCFCKPEAYC